MGALSPLSKQPGPHPQAPPSLPFQKKKGKEAGSAATLPPARVPSLPTEARAAHAGPLATAKRSKAKAKGKEAKKEVRLWAGVGPAPESAGDGRPVRPGDQQLPLHSEHSDLSCLLGCVRQREYLA